MQLVMRRYFKILTVAIAAYFLFSIRILAQNAGSPIWQGVLRDAAGLPIHGADVRLQGKSGTFSATTDTNGQFRIEFIQVGKYRLSVDTNHDIIQYATPINIEDTS